MSLLRTSNLNDLFTNTITQLYADASFAGASGNDVFFTFSWPMSPLQESDYQNPWSPINANGSMLAVENISGLVDSIPAIGKYFTPSGIHVSDVYETVVSSYTFSASGPQVMRQGAAIPTAKDLSALDLSKLGIEVLQAASPVGEVTVANTTTDAQQLQEAERQQANEAARLRAQKISQSGLITSASNTQPSLQAFKMPAEKSVQPNVLTLRDTGNSLATIFTKAYAIFTNTRLASIKHPQLDFHASEIQPANFADANAAANWPAISLKYQVMADNNVSENVSVSYAFCRVDINRPWMLTYLLSLQGWGIQGQRRGWLSAGTIENNNGVFPLLPVSLIVCRNLVIKSDSGSLNYNVPGLQVLAYINKLLPFAPTLG